MTEKTVLDIIVLAASNMMWFIIGRDTGFQKALKIVANGVKVVIEDHMEDEDEDEE